MDKDCCDVKDIVCGRPAETVQFFALLSRWVVMRTAFFNRNVLRRAPEQSIYVGVLILGQLVALLIVVPAALLVGVVLG